MKPRFKKSPPPPGPPAAGTAVDTVARDLSALIDASHEAMLVIDDCGTVLFANSRANQWFLTHSPLAGNPAPFPWRPEEHGIIAIQLSESKFLHVEKAIAPLTWQGTAAHLVTLHDMTPLRVAEDHLKRLNRLHAALGQIAASTTRATSKRELFEESCRIAVAFSGFRLVWVGRPDPSGVEIEKIAAAGPAVDAIDGHHVRLRSDEPTAQGPIAQTLRLGVPYVCNNIQTDERVAFWREIAERHEIRSLAICPLRTAGAARAVICFYAREAGYFDGALLTVIGQISAEVSSGFERLTGREARQRAEIALAESEARFRLFAGASREVLWMTESDADRLIYLSPAFETVFGHQTEEFINRPGGWSSLVHPGDRDRFIEALRATARQDASVPIRYRIVRPDRSIGWIEDELVAIREHGRVCFLSGSAADVTARYEAEAGLRERDERLEQQARLLDEATDAIVLYGPEQRIRFWNRGAEKLLGWNRDEAADRPAGELHFPNRERFAEALAAAHAQGMWNGELEYRTRSGGTVLVESRWTLILDDQGHPRSILTINTDITERKRREAGQLRAQRLESIGTLAGGMAHDLNNILSPVVLSSDMLRARLTDAVDLELVHTIGASARRGADVVRQVLSFARGVEGTHVPLNIRHLLPEIRHIVAETFPRNITCRTDAAHDLWSIMAEPTQIHQILLNLCLNARDAMPGGGILQLKARNIQIDATFAGMAPDARPGPHVRVQVIDTGSGISKEIRERIFEPFFTTKGPGKGTGLGLSTTMAIVRSHTGFITVESEPGRGTAFSLHFPAERAINAQTTPPTSTPGENPGRGELILVIDDEASVRSITRQSLESAGYRVLTAADGAEGLTKFGQHQSEVALIITDLMMPVMDGLAAIKAFRRVAPAIRIIAMSGVTDAAELGSAQTPIEGIAFLLKPFNLDALLSAVQNSLGTHAADRDPAGGT